MKVDIRQAMSFFRSAGLTTDDLLDIEKAPALMIVNNQRQDVPVDTSATKNSIQQHIQSASADQVKDHIGPETGYAPFIELGVVSKPNYPIQPFVRPSVFGNEAQIRNSANAAFRMKVKEKYG
jgi:hypothetical protein